MNSSCHVCIVRIIDLASDLTPTELSYSVLEKYGDNLVCLLGFSDFVSVNKKFPVIRGPEKQGLETCEGLN